MFVICTIFINGIKYQTITIVLFHFHEYNEYSSNIDSFS